MKLLIIQQGGEFMPELGLIVLGGLIVLFISLIIETIENEQEEEAFITELYWKGQIIILGDPVIIKTCGQDIEGYFRGIIVGRKQWIFRLSCEGKPKVEFDWYDILEIKKISKNRENTYNFN